jgi:putative oxidoreductase
MASSDGYSSEDGGVEYEGSSQETSTSVLPSDSGAFTEDDERKTYGWHGGLDLGLLVLRIVVGGVVGVHGLQKIFGSFGGPGIEGFAKFLDGQGFRYTTELAYLTGWTEIVGGGFLILGLLTPLAAAGVLAVLANAIYVKYGHGFFVQGGGIEYELTLAGAAFALMFTGPGRFAMDIGRCYSRRSGISGFVALLLAAAATALVFVFARK